MKGIIVFFIVVHYLKVISPSSIDTTTRQETSINRTFVIDYANDVFLKDGKPFHYISGSFHYFRAPRACWRDRFRKIKAGGLNAISTYVEWSTHEPSPRNYQFDGDADIEHFLQLAQEEGLLVILRAGPYICSERDYGGLPTWLTILYPNITFRTNDTDYENEVKKWFDVLFEKLKNYFYGNGGPIIMVQVENEYGNSGMCNMEHRLFLRNIMKSYVGEKAVLFTTDNPRQSALRCGHIPEVYATVDFGPAANATNAFAAMRKFSPRGPLINSEFYTGWITEWEERRPRGNTGTLINTMKVLLDMKASFNVYMFLGGTNFGFTNGARKTLKGYRAQVTSYDYDAPLSEAGDCTSKYFAVRELISKYHELPNISLPTPSPKGNYGKVRLESVLSIFDTSFIDDKIEISSREPKTFEQMNVQHGYMLYVTKVPSNLPDPVILYVPHFRDRAQVHVDRVPAGIPTPDCNYSIPLLTAPGQNLSIFIENQGHLTNAVKDIKGLLSAPLLNGLPLLDWTITGLPFENISWAHKLPRSTEKIIPPAVYVGELVLPSQNAPLDTYVDLTGWGKGIIFINDFNIGRYWPSIGPQVTLYVPGCYLQPSPHKNTIIIMETEHVPDTQEIVFTDKPMLDKIPPHNRRPKVKYTVRFPAKSRSSRFDVEIKFNATRTSN